MQNETEAWAVVPDDAPVTPELDTWVEPDELPVYEGNDLPDYNADR